MNKNLNEDEDTYIKHIWKENELYKKNITYFTGKINEIEIDYHGKVRLYENEKKLFDRKIEKIYEEAYLNKIQIE